MNIKPLRAKGNIVHMLARTANHYWLIMWKLACDGIIGCYILPGFIKFKAKTAKCDRQGQRDEFLEILF